MSGFEYKNNIFLTGEDTSEEREKYRRWFAELSPSGREEWWPRLEPWQRKACAGLHSGGPSARDVIVAALRRASRAGESDAMAARWIIEDLRLAGWEIKRYD